MGALLVMAVAASGCSPGGRLTAPEPTVIAQPADQSDEAPASPWDAGTAGPATTPGVKTPHGDEAKAGTGTEADPNPDPTPAKPAHADRTEAGAGPGSAARSTRPAARGRRAPAPRAVPGRKAPKRVAPSQGFEALREQVARAARIPTGGHLGPDAAQNTFAGMYADRNSSAEALSRLTPEEDAKTVHAAVERAAAGFDTWLTRLEATSWPPVAQSYVDNYLALASTTGRDIYEHAKKADSVKEFQDPAQLQAAFELAHAEALMRDHMGGGS